MSSEVDNDQRVLDVRDVIARFEELNNEQTQLRETRDECEDAFRYHGGDLAAAHANTTNPRGIEHDGSCEELNDWVTAFVALQEWNNENEEERDGLGKFLDELKGTGGDEQWEGDWYPVTLVHEDYFEDYARELAEELDLIKSDAAWPHTCIDWERAAKELLQDYTGADFNGVTYYVR